MYIFFFSQKNSTYFREEAIFIILISAVYETFTKVIKR